MAWAGRTRDIIALRTGAFGDLMDVSVDGYGSRFHIDTYRELWRVRDLVGEREVISHLLSELDEDSVFWDIGANIGTHCCVCASKASKVVAFEPNPETRSRLEDNAELAAGQINVRSEALSAESGEGKLSRKGGFAEGTHKMDSSGEVEIMTARGDDLLEELPEPDVVKLDIEGHEIKALQGMSRVLSNASHILIEVHQDVDVNEVRELTEKADFQTSLWSHRDQETFIIANSE